MAEKPGQKADIGIPSSCRLEPCPFCGSSELWINGDLEPKFVFATNVRQALDYIARGEVEAGLVYQTDVASQGDKVRTAMTVPTVTPITYPLAVLQTAPNGAGARGFADFIMSAGGQAILARHGFGKP